MKKFIALICIICISGNLLSQTEYEEIETNISRNQIFVLVNDTSVQLPVFSSNPSSYFSDPNIGSIIEDYDILTIRHPFTGRTNFFDRLYIITFDSSSQSADQVLSVIANESWCEFGQYIPMFENFSTNQSTITNDKFFNEQWSLKKIQAPEAWTISTGQGVTVAVLDWGIDLLHEDLVNKIDINQVEFNGVEGIDDDSNGYVDDIYGWNFGDNNNDLSDNFVSHGTGVSSIIAAETNNIKGMASVAPDAKILPLKIANGGVEEAIWYAMERDVDVINMSFGSAFPYNFRVDTFFRVLDSMIHLAYTNNIVLTVAAGNGPNLKVNDCIDRSYGDFSSLKKVYPALHNNVISVGSTNQFDQKTCFSSYGDSTGVDIMAPGINIVAAEKNSGYLDYISGTSVSAPMVAGACALLKSKYPNMSADSIRYYVLNSADPIAYENHKLYPYMGSGRLNVYKAVSKVDIQADFQLLGSEIACEDSVVTFIADSIERSGITYHWDFGDATYVTTSNATVHKTYTYSPSIAFDVKLSIIWDGDTVNSKLRKSFIQIVNCQAEPIVHSFLGSNAFIATSDAGIFQMNSIESKFSDTEYESIFRFDDYNLYNSQFFREDELTLFTNIYQGGGELRLKHNVPDNEIRAFDNLYSRDKPHYTDYIDHPDSIPIPDTTIYTDSLVMHGSVIYLDSIVFKDSFNYVDSIYMVHSTYNQDLRFYLIYPKYKVDSTIVIPESTRGMGVKGPTWMPKTIIGTDTALQITDQFVLIPSKMDSAEFLLVTKVRHDTFYTDIDSLTLFKLYTNRSKGIDLEYLHAVSIEPTGHVNYGPPYQDVVTVNKSGNMLMVHTDKTLELFLIDKTQKKLVKFIDLFDYPDIDPGFRAEASAFSDNNHLFSMINTELENGDILTDRQLHFIDLSQYNPIPKQKLIHMDMYGKYADIERFPNGDILLQFIGDNARPNSYSVIRSPNTSPTAINDYNPLFFQHGLVLDTSIWYTTNTNAQQNETYLPTFGHQFMDTALSPIQYRFTGCDSIMLFTPLGNVRWLVSNDTFGYDDSADASIFNWEYNPTVDNIYIWLCHGSDTFYKKLGIRRIPNLTITGDSLVCNLDTIHTYRIGQPIFTNTDYVLRDWEIDKGEFHRVNSDSSISVFWNNDSTWGNVSVTIENPYTGCHKTVSKEVEKILPLELNLTGSTHEVLPANGFVPISITNSHSHYNQIKWSHDKQYQPHLDDRSAFDATLPGVWKVTAENICGLDTASITLYYECSNTTKFLNQTVTNSSIVGLSEITFEGQIFLDGTITFDNMDIQIVPGTEIFIDDLDTITISNSTLRSCCVNGGGHYGEPDCDDHWNHIKVSHSPGGSGHNLLTMYNNIVTGAKNAIYVEGDASIDIASTVFMDNGRHLVMIGPPDPGVNDQVFLNCRFNRTDTSAGTDNTVDNEVWTSDRHHVYMRELNHVLFHGCNFYQPNSDSVVFCGPDVEDLYMLEDSFSIPNAAQGMYLYNSNLRAVSNNVLLQDTGARGWKIQNEGGFNTLLEMSGNAFYGGEKAVEVYAQEYDPMNISSIDNNLFENQKYGVIVSYEENPHNASSGANQYTDSINLELSCNDFWNNDYAILGSGFIMQQGDTNNGVANTFNNNNSWDLIWQMYNPSSDQRNYYEVNSVNLSGSLSLANTGLNGTTITSGNWGSHIFIPPTSSNRFCGPSVNPLLFDERTESQNTGALNVYPVPFSEQLIVQNKGLINVSVVVYDITGKLVQEAAQLNGKSQLELSTQNWTPGVYLVNATYSNGHTETMKIIKLD